MKKELFCIIRGSVQGVMFRDFVQRKAEGLNIVGTVKNKTDGSVEVVAIGEEENLQKLLSFLKKGPLLTRIKLKVTNVEVRFSEPTESFLNFKIIY
ncbi:MAG: acylphosphatase [Candidatus Paceibacterota bacterium]|jgi:acylphosphatase